MKKKILLLAIAMICLFTVPVSAASYKKVDSTKIRGAVKVGHVWIYEKPSKSSKRLKKKVFGDKVKILSVGVGNEWYHVKNGNVYGYMRKAGLVKYNKKKKHVALTFDDGPSASTTPTVIKALKKYNCRATFFVLGNRINKKTGKLLKQEMALGCEIGNHSYSHPQLTHLSSAGVKSQLSRTDKLVKKYTGKKPTLCRAPYGSYNSTVLKIMGRANIFWSVDTNDWKYRNTSRLVSYVPAHAKDGGIILMHDIHKTTVKAVGSICKKLKKKNFETVTVTELAAIKGKKLKTGKTYSSIR